MTRLASLLTGAAALTALGSGAALAQASGTVAFLMPDQASTRYEQHDFPGFKAAMAKLCADCKVIYQNADADVALPAAAVQLGHHARRKSHRARPGRFKCCRVACQPCAEPGREGDRL